MDNQQEQKGKVCRMCNKWFIPNKYKPAQSVCSALECQYQRQLQNIRTWREKNPEYFRLREATNPHWKDILRSKAKKWRQEHSDYIKLYKQVHREHHREYMREYMRKYRERRKEHEPRPSEKPLTMP